MSMWLFILLSIAGLLVIAVSVEIFLKRNKPRPSLAKQFLGDQAGDDAEDKPELGMEEIDMDIIRASESGNKAAASLGARDMQFWTNQTKRRAAHKNDPRQGEQK